MLANDALAGGGVMLLVLGVVAGLAGEPEIMRICLTGALPALVVASAMVEWGSGAWRRRG